MLFVAVNMLKKKLGINAIERDWGNANEIDDYFKIPSTLIIPEGCEWIGRCIFWCYGRLERVVIPKSVVKIGDWAFNGLKNTEIVIKNKNIRLGANVFTCCRKVEYVEEEIRN